MVSWGWRDGSAVQSFCSLPRAQVQFPASAWWFSTIRNSSAGDSSVLFWPGSYDMPAGKHTHIKWINRMKKLETKLTFLILIISVFVGMCVCLLTVQSQAHGPEICVPWWAGTVAVQVACSILICEGGLWLQPCSPPRSSMEWLCL